MIPWTLDLDELNQVTFTLCTSYIISRSCSYLDTRLTDCQVTKQKQKLGPKMLLANHSSARTEG